MPATGLNLNWLDIDDKGLAIESALRSHHASALFVNPVHQFPLGVQLSAVRTEALVNSNVLLIEDDSNAHLQHDNSVVPALHSVRPDNTVYVGSLSRSLAPGIRLGFLIAPGVIGKECARIAGLWGMAPSAIEQAALAHFISSGALERHQRLLRSRYRRKAHEFRAALSAALPDVSTTFPASGFHALLELGATISEAAVAREAAHRGIRVYGLAEHVHAGRMPPPALVIGYGSVSRRALPVLAADLRSAITAARRSDAILG